MIDLLLAAQRESGATLVVVTHDPGVAGRLDRTVRLRDGRLTTGSSMLSYVWRDLLRNPRRTLASLVGVTLGVGLFSGVLFFIDGSGASMTKRAIAPLDARHAAGAHVAARRRPRVHGAPLGAGARCAAGRRRGSRSP